MRTIFVSALMLAGLASTSPCLADPASLLAPDDPSYSSGWHPPALPTAGLQAFSPAETKDWLQLNRDVTPSGASMGGMSGMGGMKGMEKPTMGAGAKSGGGSMNGMPGMSRMPGMGTAK